LRESRVRPLSAVSLRLGRGEPASEDDDVLDGDEWRDEGKAVFVRAVLSFVVDSGLEQDR
jgi:hypothetical protein